MKLPLGQAEKLEIQKAYEKLLEKMRECEAPAKALVDILETKKACLSRQAQDRLSKSGQAMLAALFVFKVLNYKVDLIGWEGREYDATEKSSDLDEIK